MAQCKPLLLVQQAVLVIQVLNNIQQMQPLDIQRLAHEACFAIQYQVKSKAEQKFYNLCLNISQGQLEQLMKNYSQNVLFVTMEYIQKVLSHVHDKCALFLVINESVQLWYNTNPNASLIRGDGIPLQYHVENSVARTIGQYIKFIYIKKQKQDWMKQFILSRPNLRYRLYLWKLFIQTVSIVDNNLTFLVYRTLVYNFQQHIIPLIMDALIPFFKSVREQIQINDLSIYQSMLSVEDNHISSNPEVSLFNSNQLKFTKMVFQVLKQVICFNYNITYSEYQSEIPIENCLVCFPDPVTKKVANKQFITSIFFVAQKLINDNFEQSNMNQVFLATALQCIQKIMLTKLFYTSSEVKQQFIKTVLTCVSKLMDSNKLNQSIVLSLIQSNLKLLINIELHQIRSHQVQYQTWMVRIKKTVLEAIARNVINIDSQIIFQSIQLVAKIVQQSIAPQLKGELKIFKNFGCEIALVVLEKLFTQNQSMIGVGKIRSFDDLKKNVTQFLKRIRHLCCLNLFQLLKKIEPFILKIFHNNNANSISNVYLFFSQFCDCAVLQKSILYEAQQPGTGFQLGKLLYYCLEWISKFRNLGESVEIIEISMLIFIEKLLSQMLTYFTYEDNQVKISAQIYKYITEGRHLMAPEQFLIFCYREIATNLTTGDFNRSSYTFQILTTLLLKFKWGIRRQYFKQTSIAKDFLQLCRQLSETKFDGQTLTLRKELYKIITNISFDDTLDDYRANIDDLIKSLEQNLYINKWRVMYDLTGICEAIDTSAIYRYFIIGLQKSKIPIPTIMNELFKDLESVGSLNTKMQIIKAILKLQLSMVENKGQRLSSQKNIFYNYKIIAQLMPYWTLLLEQTQFQSEEWDEVIIFIYRIFNTVLKNGNTNFFMLERTVPSYPNYLKFLMMNMLKILKWVEQYPQLFSQYRNALQNISSNLMEVIFCNQDRQVVEYFNQTLNNFMDINVRSIQTLNQGNKNLEQTLETQLEIVKNVFHYLKYAKKLQHKHVQIRNFPILNEGIEHKYNYILALFKLGISSGKKIPRILDVICKSINNMDFLAGACMPMISQRLGLDEETGINLLRIWRQSEESKAQFGADMDEDGFLTDIKQWFRKCNNSTMVEPDY